MLKITSLAIGLIVVMTMAPNSQAMTSAHPAPIQTAQGEMHAQVGGSEEVKRDGDKKRDDMKRDGDKKRDDMKRDGDKKRGDMKRDGDKKRNDMKRGDKKRGEDKKRSRKNRSESRRRVGEASRNENRQSNR
jgi:Skp family chaperone for outer membrane proteins